MKYRVIINKWVYVNADSADEAMDKAAGGETVYEEAERKAADWWNRGIYDITDGGQ